MSETIITRFPPSPTGSLHIGNIRTLLFNYLFTRKHDGIIVMRFEDTDRERSDVLHEQVALQALEALGLDYDKGPYRQSERTAHYTEALKKLLDKDLAYIAEPSEGEPGAHVVRFRNPNRHITFTDLVRGDITIDTTDFGDFVIARSETNPIYHLSVVVDDIEMGITHVIRGEDHITSTPRQILLIEALGGKAPTYAHLPLIIGEDKKKLGKRHGAVTYQEFADLGYIPAAIINYLALLGWNPGDDREFFTKEELINAFSLERVNNSPATFSYEKLRSINRHHILALPRDEYITFVTEHAQKHALGQQLVMHPAYESFVDLVIRERIDIFSQVFEMLETGECDWFLQAPTVLADDLLWKDALPETIHGHLVYVAHALTELTDDTWNAETIKNAVWTYADEKGRGEVLWPTRFALTGQKKSPDPFTVASLLGKEETLRRLHTAVGTL